MESLGKSTGECRNKHSDKFPKFLKIFGKDRKMSQSAQDDLPAFKFFFMKSSEVIGNLRKSSEKFEKCRKVLKTIFRHFLKVFENFRKSLEVFGNARKTSENLGKFSNVIGGL